MPLSLSAQFTAHVSRLLFIVLGIVVWKLNPFMHAWLLGLFGILFGISLYIIPTQGKINCIVGWSMLGASLICLVIFLFLPLGTQ